MRVITIEKTTIKQTKCEVCSCLYVYDVSRKATRRKGSATSTGAAAGGILGALVGAAIDAASNNDDSKMRQQAEQDAQKRIERAVEMVACPSCGWYQSDMVKEARKRARRSGGMITLVVFGFLGLVALFLMASINGDMHTRNAIPQGAIWIAAAVVVFCGAVYALRWVQLGNYDVNAGYPTRRPPIKGAPQGTKVMAAIPLQSNQ
jgi:cytochrome bd-type quinol oxidase subunit 2